MIYTSIFLVSAKACNSALKIFNNNSTYNSVLEKFIKSWENNIYK